MARRRGRRVAARAGARDRPRAQLHRHGARLRRRPQRAARRRRSCAAAARPSTWRPRSRRRTRLWPARTGTHADEAFPADHVRACTERSLRNLGLEAIDVQQFHVWHDDWLEQGDWLRDGRGAQAGGQDPLLRRLDQRPRARQRAGARPRRAVADTVQVIYNVFDQSPEDELFPAVPRARRRRARARAARRGRADRRASRRTREFPEGDFRARYFRDDRKREVHERAQAIARRPRRRGRTGWPRLALRYILSAPEVSTVIPGMRSRAQRRAQHRRRRRPRARRPSRWSACKAHRWVRNFYA